MAKCFPEFNTDFFVNIQVRFNAVQTADELQTLIDEVFAQLSYLKSTIYSQMSYLEPIEDLLTAPSANLTKIVSWISDFITNFLEPIYKPYTIYAAQDVELIAQVAELTTLINTIASEKFPDVTFTIPSVSASCEI